MEDTPRDSGEQSGDLDQGQADTCEDLEEDPDDFEEKLDRAFDDAMRSDQYRQVMKNMFIGRRHNIGRLPTRVVGRMSFPSHDEDWDYE
jgi:hypothetical protein